MPPRASTSRIPRPKRPAFPARSSTDVEPQQTHHPASSSRSPIKKRSSASMLRASDFKRASADSLPPLPPPPPLPATDSTTATPAPLSAPSSPPPNLSPPPPSKAKKKSHASARPLDHTPRPPNSWILYRSDVMKKIKNAKAVGCKFEIPPGLVEVVAKEGGEGILQGDLSKLISCFWRNESKEVKTAYEQLSQVKKREVSISFFPSHRSKATRSADFISSSLSLARHPVPRLQIPARSKERAKRFSPSYAHSHQLVRSFRQHYHRLEAQEEEALAQRQDQESRISLRPSRQRQQVQRIEIVKQGERKGGGERGTG
jgi:hypothetical protein